MRCPVTRPCAPTSLDAASWVRERASFLGSPVHPLRAGSCTYQRAQTGASVSAGHLVTDSITLGGVNGTIVFGCETRETGELHRQAADGILGLGIGSTTVLSQLARAGVVSDEFSLCFGAGSPDSDASVPNGAIVFGALPGGYSSDTVFVPLSSESSAYSVNLTQLLLNGRDIAANASSPGDVAASYNAGFGTVLDSGTSYLHLPSVALAAFKAALRALLPPGAARVAGPQPSDVCFAVPGLVRESLADAFPPLPCAVL